VTRWPALGSCPLAAWWLVLQGDLGRSPRTIEAYARSLVGYLGFCERHEVDVVEAGPVNATVQLRVTAVRLFYDLLGLAYDAGLRREENCACLRPMISIQRPARSRAGGDDEDAPRAGGALLGGRWSAARRLSHAPADHHNRARCIVRVRVAAQPRGRSVAVDVVEGGPLDAVRAGVDAFSTHTLRHLCLTDLARSVWELHQTASFAGHQKTDTTQRYIHPSGRDLADRLASGTSRIHAQRIAQISEALS
jgi:integrase/recombinase XerD